ncbi:hypothetical protein K502DRAFT_369156 [Neoconidiobolus thromboides FSU 785]|nr:hypothetical protein K502DRAFT_369156 [Neoconidiobolus thromboides FSU 785]
MKPTFDSLSDILLEEIFQLLNPKELFNLRFLNKSLFSIINGIIKYNLTHTVYFDKDKRKYMNYQEIFIKKHGPLVRYLSLNEHTINFIKYCPNVNSIFYDGIFNDESKFVKLAVVLPKLKKIKLHLHYEDYIFNLRVFEKYLQQAECVEIDNYQGNIGTIFGFLNPSKLISFKLSSQFSLDLDGLDKIKVEFNKLRVLKLFVKYFDKPANYKRHIDFNSDLELTINGNVHSGFDVNCFGNLNKLKSVKLDLFGINLDNFNARGIEDSNIRSLGPLGSDVLSEYDFNKITTLKSIICYYLSKDMLKLINLLPNIDTVTFCVPNLKDDNCILKKFDLSNSNLTDIEYYNQLPSQSSLIQCIYIKKLQINILESSFQNLFYFMMLFPNLKYVHISHLQFPEDNESDASNEIKFNHKLKNPLSLTFSNSHNKKPHYIDIIYSKLNEIPMLSWFDIDNRFNQHVLAYESCNDYDFEMERNSKLLYKIFCYFLYIAFFLKQRIKHIF